MARKSLVWNGDKVTAKMREAQKRGINFVMAECVKDAKANHSWHNQSGVLEGGIGIATFASEDQAGVVGTWGVQDVAYALIHELGGVITPKAAKALAIPQEDGSVRFAKSVTIPARPYLRPAADRQYPRLTDAIRAAFASGSKTNGNGGGTRG